VKLHSDYLYGMQAAARFVARSIRFARRVLWEFGPPAIATYLIAHFWPEVMSVAGWASKTAMYVILNYCWLQMLRIWHQQAQKADISKVGRDIAAIQQTTIQIWGAIDFVRKKGGEQVEPEIKRLEDLVLKADLEVREANSAYQSVRTSADHYLPRRGPNVFVEARPKRQEGGAIDDYSVEDHANYVLHTARTQADAIQWAKIQRYYPLVPRVRHLNDKSKPDHWRSA
jgi:hypothetical protein